MSKIGKKVNPIRPGAPIVSPATPRAVISVEKNSFHIDSLFLSILTFTFDLILGHFLLFGALTGYYWGWGRVQTLFWGLLM